MTMLVFTLIIVAGAIAAGFVGSLTGLGGGVIIIPLLTVLLHIDLHYAVGTALISVIATSSGSAAAYVREGVTNIRLGMFLEIATTLGAIVGAVIALHMQNGNIIAVIFGFVLIFNGINSLLKKKEQVQTVSSVLATKLKLPASYPDRNHQTISYGMKNVIGGFGMMMVAGMLSAMLGIGSGAFKVIAMDNIMKVPFKVSTTTSNFMMGVTATASAVIYLQKGYIQPNLCLPVVIGVLIGSMIGARVLLNTNPKKLRLFFSVVILGLAINMIINGFKGKF